MKQELITAELTKPRLTSARVMRIFLAPVRHWKAWVLPTIIVVVWAQLAARGVLPSYILPSPSAVVEELHYLWQTGELSQHIHVTLLRVATGFVAGALAATLCGALAGYSTLFRDFVDPTLQAIKAIPSLGWVPLFILWFGIFETSKIALIAVGVFFPVYLNLMNAVRDADRKLFEVAKVYRLSTWHTITRVLLPGTLPAYLTGLRSGLALGWMFVIAAELMGASQGLGFLMLDGQMTGNPAAIIGALLLFALLGKASDLLLTVLSARALSWQDGWQSSEQSSN